MRMLDMVRHSGWLRMVRCLSWRIQLLHLYPLTLGGILGRDPQEKVGMFPRLGYYFVVNRSVDLNKYLDARDLEHDVQMGLPLPRELFLGTPFRLCIVACGSPAYALVVPQ